ncbi:MAG: hypothetical protein LBC87_10950 [Fibromonadaceae bacterium]|jgi:hypothetical protein|nr:hypothetical protein [Fibromonadaceae bacterium]
MRHSHFLGLIFIIAAIAAFAAVTMLLWNWLMPAIFGLKLLTYWQAAGILVLARLLFGGIGHHGPFGHGRGHKFREKWQNMSEEERKAFMEAKWHGGSR